MAQHGVALRIKVWTDHCKLGLQGAISAELNDCIAVDAGQLDLCAGFSAHYI